MYPWLISLPLAHGGELHAGDLLIVVPLAIVAVAGIVAVVRAGVRPREPENSESGESRPSEGAGPIERHDRTSNGE